jgi:DNA helicase-2/ATP-dependent DNA helicase PcrA
MNLNTAQKEAISSVYGNYAVIAAAGSGKTTVITKRIENLVKAHSIAPDNILAITFSKKAKENIQDRLDKLGILNVNVETFHSLALKIIIQEYGQSKYTVWTTQWEKEKAIQDICMNLKVCQKNKAAYNEVMQFISKQKSRMLTPANRLIYGEELPYEKTKMKCIYKEYESYKARRGYIEFDDFLNIANDILDTDDVLLSSLKNKYKFVLSDEFQDISMPQSLLLKKLNNTDTMIVGDPLQAIYSFRGGDSKYIMNFDKDYNKTHIIHLNTNYRCSHDIVSTANALASDIPDSKHKYYVESIASNPEYRKPEFRIFKDEYDEASWVTEKIKSMASEYKYKDFAVLSRTNAQLTKMQVALRDADIPFEVVGGKVFTDLPEITLLLSYLKLSMDENNNSSFAYVYNKPNRWLDKKFFKEVEDTALSTKTSYYRTMFGIRRKNWKFKNGIDELENVIERVKSIANVVDKIKYIRRTLNIDGYVSTGKVADDGSSCEQVENMNAFENMASHFNSLEKFIFYLNNLGQNNSKSKNKVNLMTIHKAKGLEYPVVFIIGCNEGLLPHEKNDSVDDEKRLFYVAITRAEKELYLSSTLSYNAKDSSPSSFIKDIKSTICMKKVENI